MDNEIKKLEEVSEEIEISCEAVSEAAPSENEAEEKKKVSVFSKIFRSPNLYLSLCFILPAVIMYLIYLSREIHPFGDGSVLVLDLNGQYVYFFEALRNFVHGDASLLYSFSRALGGEFMGIYAYYIASPLSYLVCLFPKERMLEALLVLFLLKTGGCGLTFGYYLHKTSEKLNRVSVICFSMLYALSAYCVVQQHNSMWIDAVNWLPIIAYGIEELIKKGHYKLFVASLALTILSNFYIGWMSCIFCAVYFFVYYFMHNEKNRNNPYREKAHFAKSFLRMVFFSALGVAISAVIILTAYYSLTFGKTTFSDTNWSFKTNFDLLDMLVK
ncbi:MAG: YfhO family protein, partial [Clostridia bacterium]|nr:YfhO family protein [Clostridia bacterium]